MGEKKVVIDKHPIVDVFKIFNKGQKEQNHVDKQIAKAMLQHIALPGTYVKTKYGVLIK